MKVSLAYPGVSTKERYGVDIGEIGGRQAPLGPLSISAYLKANSVEVDFIDAEARGLSPEETAREIRASNPDIVGISSTTVAFKNTLALTEELWKTIPGVHIVLGGPHATAAPEDALSSAPFAACVIGEGELTFLELVRALDSGAPLSKIAGIAFLDDSKRFVRTPARPRIDDLDVLPPPDRAALGDMNRYRPPVGCYKKTPVVSIVTSRGCPYGCVFCDNNTFGRKTRYFSPGRVVDEIERAISELGAREIAFLDDTFPANRKRILGILELLDERGLRFPWTCMANVNDLDEELLAKMRRSGCWQIAIGIESGDNSVLKTIKKGITVERVERVVRSAHALGIQMKGFFILGLPGETRESVNRTIALATRLPLTDITCTIATPIKGTEFHDMALSGEYGSFDSTADTSQFNYWRPVFVPNGLTPEFLLESQRRMFKKFYTKPGTLLRQLRKIRNPDTLFRLSKAALKILANARNGAPPQKEPRTSTPANDSRTADSAEKEVAECPAI